MPTCFDLAQGSLDDWPNCTVPDCGNKACLRFNSEKCYPHTLEEVIAGKRHLDLTEADWAHEVMAQWQLTRTAENEEDE